MTRKEVERLFVRGDKLEPLETAPIHTLAELAEAKRLKKLQKKRARNRPKICQPLSERASHRLLEQKRKRAAQLMGVPYIPIPYRGR